MAICMFFSSTSAFAGEVNEIPFSSVNPPKNFVFDFRFAAHGPYSSTNSDEPSASFGSFITRGADGSPAVAGAEDIEIVAGLKLVRLIPNPTKTDARYILGPSGYNWLTPISTGIDPTYGTGAGSISVVFEEDVCAVGLELIQSESINQHYGKPLAVYFTFFDRSGAEIETETRWPRNHYTTDAFAAKGVGDWIAALTVRAETQHGFAISQIIAQPCAAPLS
jgi:hypothetical protein